jgi:hypothetical protein
MIRTGFVCFLLASGCATQAPFVTDQDDTRYKAWEDKDAPDHLDVTAQFVYTYSDLPTEGSAHRTPWAGTYWPIYKDSINDKWDGDDTKAPSTKFGEAFNVDGIEDLVSNEFGIDSRAGKDKECSDNDACDEGSVCSIRDGEDAGYCIETWFGICHAWAPAAVMEPEPIHPVTHNGVSFKVNDIKALVTAAYDEGLQTQFLSGRCDEKGDSIEKDENGYPVPPDCADTNPGSFHVVVANLLGIQRRSFVEDRTWDYEVWNQPIRDFEVTKDEVITATEAMELIGQSGDTYTPNAEAATLRHLNTTLRYIAESPQHVDGHLASQIDTYTGEDKYDYILELNAAGAIIGGEWVGDSVLDHPDFLWLPTIKSDTTVAGMKWADVKLLLSKSIDTGEDDAGGFDWGDACESGQGDFQQYIADKARVEVGTIPLGKANVRIDLIAGLTDVDVQLYTDDGFAIVDWEETFLNGDARECKTRNGVEYCYSGYNGVKGKKGNEYIEINGVTNEKLTMHAYGYQAGQATVLYRYSAPENCVDSGSGTFDQLIEHEDVVVVGDIPAGKENVRIDLTSDEDVDIQLFAGSEPLVKWASEIAESGLLNGADRDTVTWEGMHITYSGYNGDGHFGKEYILIEGVVSTDLTMKAYGYAKGTAKVDYAWGLTDL